MLRAGHLIFLCALALLTIGVVMVHSASMAVDPVEVTPTSAAVLARPNDASLLDAMRQVATSKSVVYATLAVVALLVASFLPLSLLTRLDAGARRWGLAILAGGVVALLGLVALVYVPGLGRETNGAHRWIFIALGGGRELSIQPSEIAKWGLVILLAIYGATHLHAISKFWRGLCPALLALGAVAAIVAHEDLGTGVLIASAGGLVLLAAGARLWQFVLLSAPAVAGVAFLILSSPYRLERVKTFLDPYADPQGSGFHMIQSMAAVAGGEGWGRGLGDGLQKFGYLPEDTTDFLFAIICEELGVAGAGLVVMLYIAMLCAGLLVVRKQPSPVLKLIGLGVIATVGLQALINLAVVTGLGPTKGIALPLISSGGTGWILTAASLGLLVGMDRLASRSALATAQPSGHLDPIAASAPPNRGDAPQESPAGATADSRAGILTPA